MKSSWKIGTIAGIELRLHFTFPLLLIWIGLSYYSVRQSWVDVVSGVGFTLALFTVIVLHELGHALTARRYGIGTKDITLLPIGGLARLERIPENPRQELVVALAGPAVNVVIALVLLLGLWVAGQLPFVLDSHFIEHSFFTKLLWVNLIIVGFNMIPAFPMDGGRVLRALLAMRMNYARATNIAATIGQGFAWVLGIVGLFIFGNPFMIIIALFVWIGAAQEAAAARMKSSMAGVTVDEVMMTEFRVLTPECPLSRAVEHVLAGFQQDFPVVEDHKPVGLLTRSSLLTALAKDGPSAKVSDAMLRDFVTARAGEPIERALSRLDEDTNRTILVLRSGELAGVLSAENLGEFFMIQTALRESKERLEKEPDGIVPESLPKV